MNPFYCLAFIYQLSWYSNASIFLFLKKKLSKTFWRIEKVQMEEDGEKEEAAAEKIFHLQAKWHMTRHMLSTHRRRKKKSTILLESASDSTRKAKILTTTLTLAVHVQLHIHQWKNESYHWTQCVLLMLIIVIIFLFVCSLYFTPSKLQYRQIDFGHDKYN